MHMHIGAQINPSQQQFKDVKIGDDVSVTMPAWHWIELISELHTIHRMHDVTPSALFQTLAGLVFQEMTPEEYRKSMLAEYAEVQERVQFPFPAGGIRFATPEDFTDDDDERE